MTSTSWTCSLTSMWTFTQWRCASQPHAQRTLHTPPQIGEKFSLALSPTISLSSDPPATSYQEVQQNPHELSSQQDSTHQPSTACLQHNSDAHGQLRLRHAWQGTCSNRCLYCCVSRCTNQVYKYVEDAPRGAGGYHKISVYISFGGLLMQLQGDAKKLADLDIDQNVYLLIRKVN